MNLENKIIGNRYKILSKIGTGGMATVYKAKCELLNRYVAIKVLREEFITDEDFVKKFNTEAQSAASLTHPNIVQIYDVGHVDNIYYIVMELVQGKTLKDIIKEEGALPWKWTANIAGQILSALELAHRKNIVHRDIKPHNIIITEDGVAKVTDFGIAKAVSNATITAFGNTIGSVHYFSPEHARGGFTDGKTDIYSLGIVMYEMVTGRLPFEADTPVSIALKHMQEKPIEPSKLNPDVPVAINDIIMKAIEKDPAVRYETATDMLDDLSRAIKDPTGRFVDRDNQDRDYTQRLDLRNLDNEKRKTSNKKKSKLKAYFDKHPRRKNAFIALCLILVMFASFGITALISNLTRKKDVNIPNLVGMKLEEAETLLKDQKFDYEVVEEYSEEVEEGYIIKQDPAYIENFKVKEKSHITIVVSKGTMVVEMPDLIGLLKEEAERTLEEVGLTAEFIEEKSTKVEEGKIVRQEIKAKEKVNAGKTVKVFVSIGTGVKQVTMPYVVGKNKDEAKSELEALNLKVVLVEEVTSGEAGKVLKQSVEVGNKVDEGTTIKLSVSKKAEEKTCKLTVDVYNLFTNLEVDTQIQLKVKVNDDTIYQKTVTRNDGTISVGKATGTGKITVKVYNGQAKIKDYTIDLDRESSKTLD